MARGVRKNKRSNRLSKASAAMQEPDFSTQPTAEERRMALINASNWYSKTYGAAEAKDFLVEYLTATKSDKAEVISKLHKKHINTTAAWIARTATRGLILDQSQLEYLNNAVEKMAALVNVAADEEGSSTEETSSKVNIQAIMREKARDAAGEIDALFDTFFDKNECTKGLENNQVLEALQNFKVLPQHVAPIIKKWQAIRDEFAEVLEGTDEQLNEAYASYSKKQMKNKLAFAEEVITQINNYVSMKAATKKVRVRKPVPVEKLVKRLRHCKVFKDEAMKLDLVGLPASKLHGATEVFLYDTKKRKLTYLTADDYSKTLSVQGNKIVGFDKNKSQVKNVRKPNELINNLINAGRPSSRKMFDAIKAVSTIPKGKMSNDVIILKAW